MKRSAPPKRKKPLARNSKPLRRSPAPLRKKPLKKSQKPLIRSALKRKPSKPRFKRGRDPQYLEWIRGLPCLRRNPACAGPTEAAHVRSRGAGGTDWGNVIPLCRWHHRLQHQHGIRSFAEQLWPGGGMDELRRIAAEVYPAQYEKAKALGWTPGGES